MATFPLDLFKLKYPMFADAQDVLINAVADDALCYINECSGKCTEQLWMLLVAHMMYLRSKIDAGSLTGEISSATIDKVSVSFVAPPAATEANHWFSLSPFGKQFLALRKRCASPIYVGGSPERSAFRSAGGIFPNRGRIR